MGKLTKIVREFTEITLILSAGYFGGIFGGKVLENRTTESQKVHYQRYQTNKESLKEERPDLFLLFECGRKPKTKDPMSYVWAASVAGSATTIGTYLITDYFDQRRNRNKKRKDLESQNDESEEE